MNAGPTPPLRDSAAIVLLRGSGRSLEAFWVTRSDAVGYMPGFQAFLGGKVAPEDREVEVIGATSEEDRVLRACAVREAFEEAGLLLALDAGAAPPGPVALADARRRLLAGDM